MGELLQDTCHSTAVFFLPSIDMDSDKIVVRHFISIVIKEIASTDNMLFIQVLLLSETK